MDPEELAYRAVASRDARFDGVFFTAVATTRIYCRPSCPARTPARHNVRFFSTSAAARHGGYRACKRCRPDATPGSPEWSLAAGVAARAITTIRDGLVDREGVGGLARQLGYSERQLRRVLHAELGVGPLELARAQRVDAARTLLETTTLSMAEVAFAAGFSSIRQFNESLRAAFDQTPSEIRASLAHPPRGGIQPAAITLELAYRGPFDLETLVGFLGVRAVAGVEHYGAGTYRRVLSLPRSHAVIAIAAGQPHPDGGTISVELLLGDLRDFSAGVARVRRMLDLDADPLAVAEVLGHDQLLAPMVEANPGLRVPGHVDAEELAIRAILGQQVSVGAARHLAEVLTLRFGEPLKQPVGGLTHAFPSVHALAEAAPDDLPMPRSRQQTLVALARAISCGGVDLGPGSDREQLERTLLEIPGIGPWTAAYVRMRGLGDPDAFLPTDLGVRKALERLGAPSDPRGATAHAEQWRPWRAYGLIHLWSSLGSRPDAAPIISGQKRGKS